MKLKTNDIEFHWEEVGSGEPLLWLHGAMGCGADWRYLFPEPPAGFRLIAPDLRGHGATANPSGVFSFRQCSSDVMALLDHLGIERVKAIGLSGGGIVLLHLATLQPERLESIVVVSSPPYFPARARAIMTQFSETTVGELEMQRLRQSHKHGESQIAQLFAMVHAFADDYEDVNFTLSLLSRITARTLIVFGDRDPLYPAGMAMELYTAIPSSYLWIVPNGGHGPIFGDHAATFRSTAIQFLRDEWSTSEG